MVKYLFFKGCTIPAKLPHIEKLTLEILPLIDITLVETDEFSCCPDPVQIQGTNLNFYYAAAARNLVVAEEKGMNILTLCNGCLNTLAVVNHKLKNNPELKDAVNEILKEIGKEFKGTIEVKHLMQVLKEEIGFEKLKTLVKKPLTGLKIAGHPGCHLLMPDDILNFDDPADPVVYDHFIESLGATAIDYLTKTDCCGVSLSLGGAKEETNTLLRDKLVDVKESGAKIISTACPFCFTQFDRGQLIAGRSYSELKESKIPVLYAVELLALAMGMSLEEVGYKTHYIKPPLEI